MRRMVPVSVVLLLLTGCGPKRSGVGAPITGKVTYNSKPVNGAALLLYRAGGDQQQPITIPVTQEGTFSITDLPPGEYKIVVQGTAGAGPPPVRNVPPEKAAEAKAKAALMTTPATIPFPDKYKTLQKTDLKCNVTGSKQTLNLELKD